MDLATIDLFRSHMAGRVKITYKMYKEYTNDVIGVIKQINEKSVTLFESPPYGGQRDILWSTIVKYKFLK